ncbi:hypothetical protein MAR_026715, partial [Mya arenaria]
MPPKQQIIKREVNSLSPSREAERLRNVEIYIGYEQHNYKSLVAFHSGVVGASVTFTLNPAKLGRWVEVTRNPPFETLALCEFAMYTDRIPTGEPVATILNISSAMQCVIKCWEKLCTFAFYDNDTVE